MDEGDSGDGASLSEEALWRRPGEGGSFTGDPGRYVKKSPNTGISLYRGPFITEGNLLSGGEACIPGT
jgi:hypothetical protein